MAAGLEGAAAVAGLVNLTITLFDGCIKGFVLLSAASELGSKGDVLRCQLEWEHFRLNNWGTIAGLFKDPPQLNISYPEIVQATLANLEQLLSDAEKIQEQYGLTYTITDEELQDINAPKRLFGRTLGKVKPQFVNDTARVYSRRNNVWKKVKWASMDQAGLRLLLKDIRYFNERLESLLHPVDQSRHETDSNAVMRSIVTRSPNRALLDALSEPLETVDGTIAASARLKQKGLLLELLRSSDNSISGTATPTRQEKLVLPTANSTIRQKSPRSSGRNSHLQRNPKQLVLSKGPPKWASRELASYDLETVIVEWKTIDESLESKLKYRVANVATFLAEMKDPAFHSLPCCGFLKEPRSGRYAYLFQLPPINTPSSGLPASDVVMKPLDDLFTLTNLRPSINQRVSIAVVLAETVLQLHTAGWLHKSIRPDNVLFFKGSSEEWVPSDELPAAYLGGYEYARADNPLETSEDPSSRRYGDLYRHTLSLGHGRASYNQRFDLYSLGCVLLELGFWAPLHTILLQRLRSASSQSQLDILPSMSIAPADDTENYHMMSQRQRLLQGPGYDRLRSELEFRMGHAYARVVRSCLYAGMTSNGGLDEDFENSIDVQEDVLATLRKLLGAV
jgi:Prion-inhibition and propagation